MVSRTNPWKAKNIVALLSVLLLSAGTYAGLQLLSTPQNYQPKAASEGSIVLNQPAPKYNDSVNFTMVYPKKATIKVGRQQMVNPAVQIDCYQSGVRVYSEHTSAATSTQNGDGTITGISGLITLGGRRNDLNWPSGAADCYATLYYFSRDKTTGLLYNFLAQTNFSVAP